MGVAQVPRDDLLDAPLDDLVHPLGHQLDDGVDEPLLVGERAVAPAARAPSCRVFVGSVAILVVVVPLPVVVVRNLLPMVLVVMP